MSRDELLDTVVDGWRILIKIGQGATGSVYEARRGPERAALKFLRPDTVSPETLARFKRESALLREIEHPHVVRCLQTGETEDHIFLALEFLDGGSLDHVIKRRGRLGVPEAVGVTRGMLEGLAAVHARGIIHRDVKPGNLLIGRDGAIKLADFNLARGEGITADVTTTGTILGTPYYMAPEQVEGKQIGPAVDLYAAGAVLFQLLVGRPPYEGTSPLQILQKHMTADVPDLAAELPEAPPQLVEVVRRLMAKERKDRPATAEDALRLLDGLPTAPLRMDPPRPRGPGGPGSGRPLGGANRGAPGSGSRQRRGPAGGAPGRPAPTPGAGRRPPQSPRSPQSGAADTASGSAASDSPTPDSAADPAGTDELEEASSSSSRQRVGPAPLPPIKRSQLLDVFTGLLIILALLYLGNMWRRQSGKDDYLASGESWIAIKERRLQETSPEAREWQERAIEVERQGLSLLLKAQLFVERWKLHWAFSILVGLLVFDRMLARVRRLGPLGLLSLRMRARRLIQDGQIQQAAKVYELMGERARGGRLLLDNGLPLLAAEMFAAAGRPDLEGDALLAGGRKKDALQAYQASGSASAALNAARLGDTSEESARLLVQQGLIDDAIAVHRKAGRRREAAELLARHDRAAEAARELEQALEDPAVSSGRRGELARRIIELYRQAGDDAAAARWEEEAKGAPVPVPSPRPVPPPRNEALEAAKGRARALLDGGALSPEEQAEARGVAKILAGARDPLGVDLFVCLGSLPEAAALARACGDLPHAAQLHARAGQPGEGAVCAEQAGNRQLAASLYEQAGELRKASALYQAVGMLEEAAVAAGKAGDHALQASLFEAAGDYLNAGRALAGLGRDEDALTLLSKVKREHEAWREARVLTGELLHAGDRLKEAAQAYAEGLDDQVQLMEDVAPTLRYVECLERTGEYARALEVVGRLERSRLAPPDLAERRAELELASKAGPRPRVARPAPVAVRTRAAVAAATAPTTIARPPLRPGGPAPVKVAPLSGPKAPLTAAGDPRQLLRSSLNGFELTRLLDEDAFTWVYEGRRVGSTGAPGGGVAGGAQTALVKVLRPELREAAGEAYLRAGRALVGLDNPHLVRVLAAGVDDGLPYVASELIQGPDLDQLLRAEQPLTIRRAARLGAGLLNALETAHGRGIMHHDLRASRVLVAGDQVKVGDFGVARVFEQLDHTATGYLDPRYASPEQARGDEAGPAADQYVAALLIYKLFTGKLPFSSKTPRGFWTLHVAQPPTPLRDLRPDVPPPLADAIHRGLAKFPEERFPDVGAFEDMLTSFSRM